MPNIYRGWEGRYYEDFQPGDIYIHPYGRTITENDNIWFSLLTMNTNEIHFNSEYAAETQWGKPLVNSCLTLSIVLGMSVMDISQNAVNLGWEEIRLLNPVFAGDTIYAQTEVLEKRESKSRPEMGIVRFKTIGYNQDNVPVIELKRTVMVWKKQHAPRGRIIEKRIKFAEAKGQKA
ncbi:MAG: MaoC family dehydratase [Candidatus Caldarchaeum sp.]|nr:MaoC family dehydratase [Candidatus Caldarchaeum sp.]MCX8201521.1 MaoC family dehydratase [Candidatus Caldarchaeum sp.]MDW8063363.1 MaoC family dehydratase [Candidatus Caldarchaeum sp.]MDW8436156.1 MaoC family dehydratase [Candidatus Caldarchaeum sp.]